MFSRVQDFYEFYKFVRWQLAVIREKVDAFRDAEARMASQKLVKFYIEIYTSTDSANRADIISPVVRVFFYALIYTTHAQQTRWRATIREHRWESITQALPYTCSFNYEPLIYNRRTTVTSTQITRWNGERGNCHAITLLRGNIIKHYRWGIVAKAIYSDLFRFIWKDIISTSSFS